MLKKFGCIELNNRKFLCTLTWQPTQKAQLQNAKKRKKKIYIFSVFCLKSILIYMSSTSLYMYAFVTLYIYMCVCESLHKRREPSSFITNIFDLKKKKVETTSMHVSLSHDSCWQRKKKRERSLIQNEKHCVLLSYKRKRISYYDGLEHIMCTQCKVDHVRINY